MATIGYYSMLPVTHVRYGNTAHAEAAPIAPTSGAGFVADPISAGCLLVPTNGCQTVLFAPALVPPDGLRPPVINVYSGTFANFPLR